MIDNPDDYMAELRDLKRRIRELETHSALANSSISSGPGLQVRVPDGINVPDDGATTGAEPSIKFGQDGRIGGRDGGTVKIGTTEATKDGVGSGGTKVFSDGKIGREDGGELQTKGRMAVDGNLVVIGSVDGRDGVWTPWEGGKNTVEAIMGGIKTTAQNAASAASGAAGAATAAQNRADDAYALANGRVTQAQYNALVGWINQLGTAIDTLDGQVANYHPGKIGLPPYPKG